MSKLSETSSEKPPEKLAGRASLPPTPEFSPAQRQILLGIAHDAIFSVFERRPLPMAPPSVPGLAEPRGVFTTLYLCSGGLADDLQNHLGNQLSGARLGQVHWELRGCVGYAAPIAPLYRAVAETARAAAFEDSRFLPVSQEEALRLQIWLSVLSPLVPIRPEAVEVGRHGLLVSRGARRGLLLPQVPVENDWDRETFLDQTCRKAGLPLDAWRRDATLEAFTAEVFSDGDEAVPH